MHNFGNQFIFSRSFLTSVKPRITQNGWAEEMCWLSNDCIAVASAGNDVLQNQINKDDRGIMHQIMLIHNIRNDVVRLFLIN